MMYDIVVVDANGQAWSTSSVDTNREEEHLDEGAFDESKALEALERMREEIVRYQAMREDVSNQFERFVQSFKKPESLNQPQIASAEPLIPSPEARVATPLPPVPPDTPFEPLSLEPFARQIEGPRVERHLAVPQIDEPPAIDSSADELPDLDAPANDTAEPAARQRVPTSPEAFAAAREEEDPDVTFAPGEAFDALPPPLPAIDDSVALSPPPPPPRPAQTRTWVLLGGVVMVLAVGAYIWMQGEPTDATVVEQPAPTTPAEQAARSQPPPATGQATTGSSQSAPATTPPAATLQTEIVTTEPAWVRVIADGERVIERELPADARIPFKAERTIQIRTGNAGAVRLSIRGKDQGALGKIGEVVTRSFTVPAR